MICGCEKLSFWLRLSLNGKLRASMATLMMQANRHRLVAAVGVRSGDWFRRGPAHCPAGLGWIACSGNFDRRASGTADHDAPDIGPPAPQYLALGSRNCDDGGKSVQRS
jgi:hypothetical protein